MQRLTEKCSDESYTADCSIDEVIMKLGKYEDMYDALCLEQIRVLEYLEKLRTAGKVKTVTYQQLLANKMMIMNLIGRFDTYGL